MMEMNVTRGLAELKLSDKRINAEIKKGQFIAAYKQSAAKVDGLNTPDEFDKKAKAVFESIDKLIERRKAIKAAIVKSNAATMVVIGGVTMTVAEAIERKDAIKYEKDFYTELVSQLRQAQSKANNENDRVAIGLDNQVVQLFGRDAKQSTETITVTGIKAFTDTYNAQNGWVVRDPLNLQAVTDTRGLAIDKFLTEVDYVLSESNAITKIVVPD